MMRLIRLHVDFSIAKRLQKAFDTKLLHLSASRKMKNPNTLLPLRLCAKLIKSQLTAHFLLSPHAEKL